jgi:hypothetical protein
MQIMYFDNNTTTQVAPKWQIVFWYLQGSIW